MAPTKDARIYSQPGYDVRFDWGVAGVRALALHVDVLVIIDVLSFTTTVEIATARGALIYPASIFGDAAIELALDRDALLASPRDAATPDSPYSLSPASVVSIPRGTKLVLPSPNGASATLAAMERAIPVLAGSLRNARAVARVAHTLGKTIGVVAAGERWPDDTLRPAFEDLVAAGAIIGALSDMSWSAEAEGAACTVASMDAIARVGQCATARDLIDRGYDEDVRLATAVDVSEVVPLLRSGSEAFEAYEAPAETARPRGN